MYAQCPFCHEMAVSRDTRIEAGWEMHCGNEHCQAHYSLDFDTGELRWFAPVATREE